MSYNPIQIVLNSESYLEDFEHKGGGLVDFYAGKRNDAFKKHKADILLQLDTISKQFDANSYSKIGYIKVRLIQKALAKSHRPTKKIFSPYTGCEIVGGLHQGELIIQSCYSALQKLQEEIRKYAEEEVGLSPKGLPSPSAWRCELGAIDQILLYTPQDKCSYSDSDIIQWIEDKGSTIYIELFHMPPPEHEWDVLPQEEIRLYQSFIEGLQRFKGLYAGKSAIDCGVPLLAVTLSTRQENALLSFQKIHTGSGFYNTPCSDSDPYIKLVSFLKAHPLVKRIRLAPSLFHLKTPSFKINRTQPFKIPKPDASKNYPQVGIIDGGIAPLFSQWQKADWTNIIPAHRDTEHATFISGLLVCGAALNPDICKEPDGCWITDGCILPDKKSEKNYFLRYYPAGIENFYNEFESIVSTHTLTANTRIFNLSLNMEIMRKASQYSDFAKLLDRLSVAHNVIFVISAGNKVNIRQEWTDNVEKNIHMLATQTNDIVYSPAESIRNISVGALNPDLHGITDYSLRGRGCSAATKPDVVYIGGAASNDPVYGTGLYSLTPQGTIASNAGTSFAAPLVAKILANLDLSINGNVSRETLMALLIHYSSIPASFSDKRYRRYLKDTIGYGMPASSQEILNGNKHAITLVFAARTKPKKRLFFKFPWPTCLKKGNKCMGKIKVTMVSTPYLDYNYGDEMVRENVSVSLGTLDSGNKTSSKLHALYKDNETSCDKDQSRLYEWQLIAQDDKWSPVKVYEKSFPRGTEDKGVWYLAVSYQSRINRPLSPDGVPFTVVVTIEDPEEKANVYDEMRQTLLARGVELANIQNPISIPQRV